MKKKRYVFFPFLISGFVLPFTVSHKSSMITAERKCLICANYVIQCAYSKKKKRMKSLQALQTSSRSVFVSPMVDSLEICLSRGVQPFPGRTEPFSTAGLEALKVKGIASLVSINIHGMLDLQCCRGTFFFLKALLGYK